MQPSIGDRVFVRPAPEHCVENKAFSHVLCAPRRFLEAKGEEVVWSQFLVERLRCGEIYIVTAAPAANATSEKE